MIAESVAFSRSSSVYCRLITFVTKVFCSLFSFVY